ncbi:hypothetical protein LSTR_LSTR011002 [Laodelphax striatellus]|uniref:AB hydrolase-1 domain-containing protein n=1 Tax=Laodelphax striatellus TaxID=195883 RepID=A0A482X5Y8_LAOST|nr:hypothetical protein LSTR_LSTR011002 [Laodelphax striatellus]
MSGIYSIITLLFILSHSIFISCDDERYSRSRLMSHHHIHRFKANHTSESNSNVKTYSTVKYNHTSESNSTVKSNHILGSAHNFKTNHTFIHDFDGDLDCRPARSNATENCFLTTAQMIERNGYCAESHRLTTEDGYKLKFFRIRDSCPRGSTVINKPVVLVTHGLLGSSSDFVFAGDERGLGFFLLKNGFDVWLLNSRGNIYGGLDKKPGDFWDFSIQEMGEYDLPAYIDYILDYTKQDKLYYVGFSMGTSIAYVLLSMKPDYNEKIVRMVNMAPVVFIDHSESTTTKKMLVKVNYWYEEASNSLKAYGYPKKAFQFFTAPECLKSIKRVQCNRFMRNVCTNKTLSNYEKKLWDDFYRISPVGGSCKTIAHYLQISQSGVFRPFSYTEQRNVEVYNSKEPPPYQLENVRIPILLILGGEDKLTVKKNIDDMRNGLSSCPSLDVIRVPDPEFNHMDFFFAKEIASMVYEPLDTIIESEGYTAETHNLTTEDGCTLEFFRVREPNAPKQVEVIDRPVVLLTHGIMGSSTGYVFAGKGNGLAFHLVDNGFDVWLANFRGNVYGGLKTPPGDKFWDFSFHEMGTIDIPNYIDWILHYTNQEKLFYVGFSMGTTASYVMLSEKPEYNSKIAKMISMAPVVYTNNSKSHWLKKIGIWALSRLTHIQQLAYFLRPVPLFSEPKCWKEKVKPRCQRFLKGGSADPSDPVLYDDTFYEIAPAGGSVKTLAHYLQLYNGKVFRPYSHSKSKNMRRYNSSEPEPYKLSNVKVPILLLLGDKDAFAMPQNINKLNDSLTSVTKLEIKHVENKEFNHMDFFVAKNLEDLVFKPVTDYLKTPVT